MSDTVATRTVSALVLIALVALSVKLALAPFNGTTDSDGCARAYAKARTRVDTIAVDTKSFPDAHIRGLNRRCGEQRKTPVGAIAVRVLPSDSTSVPVSVSVPPQGVVILSDTTARTKRP